MAQAGGLGSGTEKAVKGSQIRDPGWMRDIARVSKASRSREFFISVSGSRVSRKWPVLDFSPSESKFRLDKWK